MTLLAALAALVGPDTLEQLDCLYTGLCRRPPPLGPAGPAPGLMFLALGLVWAGARTWPRRPPPPPACGAPPPPDVLGI